MKTTKMERIAGFLEDHKVVITATVTATATLALCIAANRMANNGLVEFIKEKNLWDDYLIAGEE